MYCINVYFVLVCNSIMPLTVQVFDRTQNNILLWSSCFVFLLLIDQTQPSLTCPVVQAVTAPALQLYQKATWTEPMAHDDKDGAIRCVNSKTFDGINFDNSYCNRAVCKIRMQWHWLNIITPHVYVCCFYWNHFSKPDSSLFYQTRQNSLFWMFIFVLLKLAFSVINN